MMGGAPRRQIPLPRPNHFAASYARDRVRIHLRCRVRDIRDRMREASMAGDGPRVTELIYEWGALLEEVVEIEA